MPAVMQARQGQAPVISSAAAGCGGIREYGPERVTLAADGGVIVIEGRGLGIEDFTDGAVLVRGEIRSVTFGEEA